MASTDKGLEEIPEGKLSPTLDPATATERTHRYHGHQYLYRHKLIAIDYRSNRIQL